MARRKKNPSMADPYNPPQGWTDDTGGGVSRSSNARAWSDILVERVEDELGSTMRYVGKLRGPELLEALGERWAGIVSGARAEYVSGDPSELMDALGEFLGFGTVEDNNGDDARTAAIMAVMLAVDYPSLAAAVVALVGME